MDFALPEFWNILKTCLFLPFGAYIFYKDARERLIPDKSVLAGLICALALAVIEGLAGFGAATLVRFLAGAIIGGLPVLLIILATRGAMGAGDMKLCALIGAWFGFPTALVAFMAGVCLCGLFAAFLLAAKRAGLKSKLPLAPFILTALALILIFREPLDALVYGLYGFNSFS